MMENILKLIIKLLLAPFLISSTIFAQTATLKATLSLKNVDGISIPYQNGIPLPTFEKQNRAIINLSGEWKKERVAATDNISLAERNTEGFTNLLVESADREFNNYDDSAWEIKSLPAVENQIYPFPTVPEYYEDGVWYRKKIQIPAETSTKQILLKCYAINYVSDIWINGEYCGYHEGGYTPFAFDVSDKIISGAENSIAIRIDNPKWGSRKDIVPFYRCDWFNYTGVIHDIYFEISDKISVSRADVVPLSVEGDILTKVVLSNRTNLYENITVNYSVFNAEVNELNIQSEFAGDLIGSEAAISGISSQNITIMADSVVALESQFQIINPNLWSPANPNLYVLKVSVISNDIVVDELFTQFGVRVIETSGDKVMLNKHVVFFTGTARHEDHPDYGRSVPKEIIFSDLNKVKEANVNFLRTGHYPNNLYTYLISDRVGIAVMEEIPVWWFDTEEPWLIQNNERHIHQQMFREMVFKGYNRPSIIMWSTSNECKETDNRLIYNQLIKDDISTNYNDFRLISQSSAGDKPGYADATQAPLDVAGWTLYFGIFHGSTYYNGTLLFLVNAKNSFPGKPIIDTEFGYWSSENGSSLNDQVEVFDETFKAFKFFSPLNENGTLNPNGMLMASTWWCIFDWYSHQHPDGYQSMGLISMDRQTQKPVYESLKKGYEPYFNQGGMVITNIKNDNILSIPKTYFLGQNYPNPFNPSTKIAFELPKDGFVSLKVYDFLGNFVSTIVNENKNAGKYEINFDASNHSSGVYFYQLISNGFVSTNKMIILR